MITTTGINTQTATAPSTTTTEQAAPSTLSSAQFTINGKIGMTTPQQAGVLHFPIKGQTFATRLPVR
ncbi:MAG: hypothetical protein U1E91_01565 [Moraxella sp.]